MPGICPPAMRPSARLTGPAIRPLISTICSGSASDTLRVRLLSKPQAMHAPTIAMGPSKPDKLGCPDQESTIAPATRQAMPTAMRRSKFSWKMNHAISAVATPSSVRRREAAAASVRVNPVISRMGPTMPPVRMAPASHGNSRRPSATSGALDRDTTDRPRRRTMATPSPAPQ